MPLTIDKKKIDLISGPVSMHILDPTPKYLELFPKAPIYILFGDHHFSDSGYCTLQNDDERIVHFNVFDKAFLQLFNDEVETNIIDLYLEGGAKTHDFSKENNFRTENASGRIGAMKELWKLFRECYSNTRMEREPAKESGCGNIKNIRWQSSDIRCFGQYEEYEIIQSEFENFARTKHRHTGEDLILEFKKIIGLNVYFKGYVEYILLTQEEFIKKYLYDDKSLIVKQLNKIKNQVQRDYLISMFENYIKTEYNKFTEDELKEFMIFNKAMIRMSNYDLSKEYNEACENVYTFISNESFSIYLDFNLHLFTLLPDLYILARSHKYMTQTKEDDSKEEIKYPLVNIVYYGDYHVDNLVTCLGRNYNVRKTYSTKEDDSLYGTRCLGIVEDFDLNAMITQLKQQRSEAIQQDKSGGKHKRRTK